MDGRGSEASYVSWQPAGARYNSQSQAPVVIGPRPAAAAESSACAAVGVVTRSV